MQKSMGLPSPIGLDNAAKDTPVHLLTNDQINIGKPCSADQSE
jgi:hypothetical protein